jgi:hypothetical protein
MAYFFCKECGYYRETWHSEMDSAEDIKVACPECEAYLITHCPSPKCSLYIKDLNFDFCACGYKLREIIKPARKKYNNDQKG